MHKDIRGVVGIAGRQVRGIRFKGHIVPVGTDRGVRTCPVRLQSGAVHAHPPGLYRRPIADEDIRRIIDIAGHQIRGSRLEGHVLSITADRRIQTPSVCLRSSIVDQTYSACLPGCPVVHEDIRGVVGIAGRQVRGIRFKGYVAPIRTDRGVCAHSVNIF